MNVAFIFSSPMMIGFLMPHLNALVERGDTVTVYSNLDDDSYGYAAQIQTRVELKQIPLKRKLGLSDFSVFFRLFFALKSYDLVITVGPKSLIIGGFYKWLRAGPKFIHLITGQVWANKKGVVLFLVKTAERILLGRYELGLADSPAQELYLKSQGYKDNIVGIVPGSIKGIDSRYFDPKDVREEMGLFEDHTLPVVGFMGRITKEKGINTLLKAHRRLEELGRPFNLLIVGPIEQDCYKGGVLSSRLVKHIDFTSDVRPFLKSMDIFCLPSEREGFGMSVLEASAMSLPVICSDIYGLDDAVVENVTGFKFKLNDSQDLSEKLGILIEDKDRRKAFGENGRRRVEAEFQEQAIVSKYLYHFVGN